MIEIPDNVAFLMAHHAIKWYPGECCGLLYADKGSLSVKAAGCLENKQDFYHERLPEDYPRTSKDAFLIDPRVYAREHDEAAERTEDVVAIFHSHIDCGAYFSEEDILMAAPFGEPNEPEKWHVVMDCQPDGVHGAKAYHWDGSTFKEYILKNFPKIMKND